MTNIHEEIEKILSKYGEAQINLTSEAAQKMIANEICKSVLSRSKTILLNEVKCLREEVKEIREMVENWPPNDVY